MGGYYVPTSAYTAGSPIIRRSPLSQHIQYQQAHTGVAWL